ncbi:unnamed protein product, partial [Musa acuminata subsp. burmannicoides]
QSTLKLTSVVAFRKLHFCLPCSSPGCGGQYRNLDLSRYLSGDSKQPFLSALQRHKSLWWCIVSFSVPVRQCTALVSLLP